MKAGYLLSLMKHILLLLCLFSFFCADAQAQARIPLESWRDHFSYQGVYRLAVTPERIYAAAANGLFYFDLAENTTVPLTKQQGLGDAGISQLAYQQSTSTLLIAYHNGNIDILQGGRIYNIRAIRDATLPGNRQIHDVLFREGVALLATDYGISVLDLQTRELRESYFNLGQTGQSNPVYQLAVWNDSLFAASSAGIIANALRGANLADFNSWKHFSATGQAAGATVRTLAGSPAALYAGADGEGLFRYEEGEWIPTPFLTDQSFRDLQQTADNALLITLDQGVYSYQPAQQGSRRISHPLIEDPYQAVLVNEHYWIADGRNGLLSDFEGAFRSYIPQGPLADLPQQLYAANEELVAVYGRYRNGQYEPGPWQAEAISGFSVFRQGVWHNFRSGATAGMPPVADLTDVAWNARNQKYYFSSFSDGLLEWEPSSGTFRHFTAGQEGVSLRTSASGETPLTAVAVDADGQVWMLQPIAAAPLHRYNPSDDSWQVYLKQEPLAPTALQLLILPNGDKWLRLSAASGILVFNEEQEQRRRLSQTINEGGLINNPLRTMVLDLEDQVWVGHQEGINYFVNPYSVLRNDPVNAILPVYERRELLNAEEISALAVDGGNRKWIGTPNGLWVFGDYGDTLHHHFTTANSPLPDNRIRDIAIEQKGGEVLISTAKGMVSYRAVATQADWQHAPAIKIFPNPVYPGYEGKVGISGLVRDAIVKITDVSGRLVKELAAEGGTASWDVTDMRGRRPATGVYLVFSASADGTETLVGKLALVN